MAYLDLLRFQSALTWSRVRPQREPQHRGHDEQVEWLLSSRGRGEMWTL